MMVGGARRGGSIFLSAVRKMREKALGYAQIPHYYNRVMVIMVMVINKLLFYCFDTSLKQQYSGVKKSL